MSAVSRQSGGPTGGLDSVPDRRNAGTVPPSLVNRAASAFVAWLMTVRTRLRIAVRLLRQPSVTIRLFGDLYCFNVYQSFSARHPKLPLVRRKSFGTALWDLDVQPDSMFDGPGFAYLRKKLRRAEKRGYHVEGIDPAQHLDQIMRIHASSALRQGREVRSDYLDRQKVARYLSSPGPWYGVFDAQNILRAYCYLPIVGDCCFYSRILGDAQRLEDGIMYLLIHFTINDMHQVRSRQGYPRWVMYDMFLGGLEGLREFKRRCGFTPQRVSWVWEERCADP